MARLNASRSCPWDGRARRATCGTARAPRTTSERPLGLLEGVLAGPGLGNWNPRRPSTRVRWEGGVGRCAVNLVVGGQSGCGATWPVWGGCALFSSGDLGGRLGILSGTVCLEPFLLPATSGGGSPWDRWGGAAYNLLPLTLSPLGGLPKKKKNKKKHYKIS